MGRDPLGPLEGRGRRRRVAASQRPPDDLEGFAHDVRRPGLLGGPGGRGQRPLEVTGVERDVGGERRDPRVVGIARECEVVAGPVEALTGHAGPRVTTLPSSSLSS